MNITRPRIFSAIIIYILTAVLLTQNVYAHSTADNALSWYCKRTRDHSRPPLPSEFLIINDHGGYYIGSDSEEKVVYLTFDAGYENGNVKKTLDILNDNDVKGAFFILSNLIKTSPELVKEMANSGHLVCNHTARHKDMSIALD